MTALTARAIESQRAVVNEVRDRGIRHETSFDSANDDAKMIWYEWGVGPALVLLHGGFGSWRHWIKNIEFLAKHFRILAADIPGLGESATVPEPTSPAQIGSIVANGIKSLAPNDPVHLAAFSFGGVIAGQTALALADQTTSVTLCGASGMGLKREKMMLVRREETMSDAQRLEANIENLKRLMLYDHEDIDPMAAFIHIENDRMARLRSRRMSMGDSLALALEELGKNKVQLNGIWGEHDITAAPWIDDRRQMLARCCPTSRFSEIPRAGHWVSYEAADIFNETLMDFL